MSDIVKELKAAKEYLEEQAEERRPVKDYPLKGELTLLPTANQEPLPKVLKRGRKSILVRIISDSPEIYQDMLELIRQGAFYHTAAESVGIGESTLYSWAAKGNEDLRNDKDSYQSRFVLDIRKAVAYCRTHCEIRVKELDPRRWLSQGPGRMFGNQWCQTTTKGLLGLTEDVESSDGVFSETKAIEDKTSTDNLVLTPSEELEKYEQLEAAGLLTLTDAYRKALQSQVNQESQDVVLEPEEE